MHVVGRYTHRQKHPHTYQTKPGETNQPIPQGGPQRKGSAHAKADPAQELTMLNTAMMRMMAVVITVREILGHGRLAMMPDDFRSHMREAEAFLLHCCGGRKRRGILLCRTLSGA